MAATLRRLAVTFALMVALLFASRVSIGAPPTAGVIRLSWRLTDNRVDVCRERTAAELAALPPHMRRPRICHDLGVGYDLEIRVDGRLVERARLVAAGLRGNRPLYIDKLFRVEPGPHDLHIELRPRPLEQIDPALMSAYLAALARMNPLVFDDRVELATGRIALLAYDPDRGPYWIGLPPSLSAPESGRGTAGSGDSPVE